MILVGYLLDSPFQDLEPSLCSIANHVDGIVIGISHRIYSLDYVELISLFCTKYNIYRYRFVHLSNSSSFTDSWKEILALAEGLSRSCHTCPKSCECLFLPLTCNHQLKVFTPLRYSSSQVPNNFYSLKEIYESSYSYNLVLIPLHQNYVIEVLYDTFGSLKFKLPHSNFTYREVPVDSILHSWEFILSFNFIQSTQDLRNIISKKSLYHRDSDFWLHLGILYFRLRKFGDVVLALELALKQNTFQGIHYHWHCLYLLSRAYLALFNLSQGVNYALKALNLKKDRLEPIYYLAHFSRIHKRHIEIFKTLFDMLPFHRTVQASPNAEDNLKVLEIDVDFELSEWKWIPELVYHSSNSVITMDLLEKLRFHNFTRVSNELRLNLLWHQRLYCIKTLKILHSSLRLGEYFYHEKAQDNEIRVWNFVNPSILSVSIDDLKAINIPQFLDGPWFTAKRDTKFFLVAIRAINYKLEKEKEGYIIYQEATEQKIKSRNFILLLDWDYVLQNKWELIDLRKNVTVSAPSYGPEDGKLFIYLNSLYYSYSSVDAFGKNGIPCIGLSQIYSANQVITLGDRTIRNESLLCLVDAIYLSSPSPIPSKPEKNWLPFVNENKLSFVYWPSPLTLCEFNLNTGMITNKIEKSILFQNNHFRNSAGPLAFRNGWLLVAHELNVKKKEGAERSHYYTHRFLWYTKEFVLQKMSYPFTFWNVLVEYCNGVAWKTVGQRLVLSVGHFDQESFLLEIEGTEIDHMLKVFDPTNLSSNKFPFFGDF